MVDNVQITAQPEYDIEFWNAMRNKEVRENILHDKNGAWLMNDRTALALRKLKDADGNYLWNQTNDTICGKQVIISEYMPDIEAGTKPIAFGDFSYYWIVGRKLVSVRTLLEKFILYDQIGYLAFEFLDGKLVRKEAIKVVQMADTEE